jgi:hypothetical protein
MENLVRLVEWGKIRKMTPSQKVHSAPQATSSRWKELGYNIEQAKEAFIFLKRR